MKMTKVMILLVIVGAILPLASHDNTSVNDELQKVYVEPAQIAFADLGIFAFVEGQ